MNSVLILTANKKDGPGYYNWENYKVRSFASQKAFEKGCAEVFKKSEEQRDYARRQDCKNGCSWLKVVVTQGRAR